ncbi:DEKNAAC102205 [Brettanomyces naardenensis]|uniref:V-type proton ATPase subunit a n=1 Tax=Brettanomyces naardenensis TaxID=13370 RepID=A0A448YL02_BRENA|nr:DEKNAAC102205 [Brettanomyces naardenensis]
MPEGSMFRSAEMSMIQLYIPAEIGRETLYSLGSLGLVEFRDLNKKVNEFQRSFVNEIRRLDNVERQYRLLKSAMDKRGIDMMEILVEDYEISHRNVLSTSELDETCSNAQLLEDRISELSSASEDLLKKQMDLKQYQQVLNSTDSYFDRSYTADLIDLSGDGGLPAEGGEVRHSGNFITGVIPRSKVPILEKILWRVLRGNLFMKATEIEQKMFDPKSKEFVDKDCFVVFSHGELILSRIRKICESLDADLYFVNPDHSQRQSQKIDINDKLADVNTVLANTDRTLETELRVVAPELDSLWKAITLEKSVYEVMNRCYYDQSRRCLIGEGWVPKDDLSRVQNALDEISTRFSRSSVSPVPTDSDDSIPIIMNIIETTRTPPTYFKTNKFSEAFQAMCDSYGTATYREVNAGLPTIATFPFIFAIMFGDLGHGFLMFLTALIIVLNENSIGRMKRDEIFDMVYYGRYIVLMMGAFSMYTGLLYNDAFSLSLTLFKSGWKWPGFWKEGDLITGQQTGVYPIGVDPIWHGAENSLLFANSYKMKLSILMGFIHMSYSYMFSLVNALYFKSPIDIIGNFIPGFIFMHGIFGYLTVCIVYKWCVDWIAIKEPAPSLLNMLINMFLSPGVIDDELYPGQATVQVILLLLALVCVPCLLLIKPLWYKHTHGEEYKSLPNGGADGAAALTSLANSNNLLSNLNLDDDEPEDQEGFGDVMINQVIHTIEFCLNCVSHTASYLRLWALSLAHSQLSTVLWSMTIGASFHFEGVVGVFFIFFMFSLWFILTVCILVVMEGTSAMLHALRLHWVESMSKYFEGEGVPYKPYSFLTVLNPEDI